MARKAIPSRDRPHETSARDAARAWSLPPRSAGMRWTEEQWAGIAQTGGSLLVSAAAGSGKTSVLAERCAYLVCDAPRPCNVDELLVVTFTEAAAAQMKERITRALQERAHKTPSQRLERQLALAPRAQVSTLHSFCLRLLREHYHRIGLDPSFRVLDGDEARLMRREIARDLFRDSYELDNTGEFHRLIDAYCDGDDDRVLRQVLHAHELLTSVRDPDGWLAHARGRIAEAANGPLEESELGRELIATIQEGIDSLHRVCADAQRQVSQLGFVKYTQYLDGLARVPAYWAEALREGGLAALCEVVNDLEFERLPTERGDAADRERGKAFVDAVRKEMKEGAWRSLLRFTPQQWQAGLTAIQPHAEAFLNRVERFRTRYAEAKRAARAIDFADLERMALDVLQEESSREPAPSDVARTYHKRFAHVLVDEYQDINEVQEAILHLVSQECVEDDCGGQAPAVPNFFAVGDVKQSIYRFRLASPEQFMRRESRFRTGDAQSTGAVIDLQHNFRSRKPLLDAINAVFRRLMTGGATGITYDHSHELRAKKDFPNSNGTPCFTGAPIELHLLPERLDAEVEDADVHAGANDAEAGDELERTEREAILVAQRIRQIIHGEGDACPPMHVMEELPGGGSMRPRPARYGDIVICLRAMRFKADAFARVLRQFDIPVHAESSTGFFESMEVRDMLSLLSLLDNQRQDIPLAAVLRSPLIKLSDPETSLARVRLAYPAPSGDKQSGLSFHEAVARYAVEQSDELAARLRAFFEDLGHWREAAHRRPLADVIWQIYQQTGYLAYVSGLRDGRQRVANLMYLHERAGQFGSFRRQGIARFMRFLRELEAESDLGQAPTASEADDVVRIISVHQSKGLEFPIVILPDLGKAINLSDTHGHILLDRAAGLGMSVVDERKQCRYPSLALAMVKRRLREQTLAEELRVLYVAMTRAKEHLILVGTCKPKSVEQWNSRWAGQEGELPADVVLNARTMLDWVGPVAAMTSIEPFEVFRTTMHSATDVSAWKLPDAVQRPPTPEQLAMARLEPPPVAGLASDMAREVIERIGFVYPHHAYTQLPAARAVSRLKEAGGTGEPSKPFIGNDGGLALPTFLNESLTPAAADRGTATHLALQHLNFMGTGDATDVAEQIKAMVERKVLTSTQAKWIDLDAIRWLIDSEIGQLLRQHARMLKRELSVYFAQAPEWATTTDLPDPLDRIMVRGRLDVLIPLPDGAILIDYKTDTISPDQLPARAASYEPQIDAYRHAIERITGNKVKAAYLVFLTPRMIWMSRWPETSRANVDSDSRGGREPQMNADERR